MSAADAVRKYYERQLKASGPKRKNKAPEAELQKSALLWLNANGFTVFSVDSKAVWSKNAGRYLRGQTNIGCSDIVGACPGGIACFIELKAPGKRSTLREAQRHFLIDKINAGAFAIVADSISSISEAWSRFKELQNTKDSSKHYLIAKLPMEQHENQR
jgi:hypothetical protein